MVEGRGSIVSGQKALFQGSTEQISDIAARSAELHSCFYPDAFFLSVCIVSSFFRIVNTVSFVGTSAS
jgi:hypothetical protein